MWWLVVIEMKSIDNCKLQPVMGINMWDFKLEWKLGKKRLANLVMREEWLRDSDKSRMVIVLL